MRSTPVEPRRLLKILKVEWTLGEPKGLGLNWNNRRDSYIRNGMHCNYKAHGAHIYVMSKRLKHTLSLDTLIIRRRKNNMSI